MTQEEILKEITKEHKWYINHYSQGYASQLVSRLKNGQLKESTIKSFFGKFGYVLNRPAEWIKSDGKPSNLKTK